MGEEAGASGTCAGEEEGGGGEMEEVVVPVPGVKGEGEGGEREEGEGSSWVMLASCSVSSHISSSELTVTVHQMASGREETNYCRCRYLLLPFFHSSLFSSLLFLACFFLSSLLSSLLSSFTHTHTHTHLHRGYRWQCRTATGSDRSQEGRGYACGRRAPSLPQRSRGAG